MRIINNKVVNGCSDHGEDDGDDNDDDGDDDEEEDGKSRCWQVVEELLANGGSGFTQCAVSLLSAMFNLVPKWL